MTRFEWLVILYLVVVKVLMLWNAWILKRRFPNLPNDDGCCQTSSLQLFPKDERNDGYSDKNNRRKEEM